MKIISFSLWGNNPKYLIGAVKNARIARDLFPDWICYFYIPSIESMIAQEGGVALSAIHTLIGMDNCCVIETNQPGDWRGMFWRFRAASDPVCEVMISRDCDSRLSLREKAAVDEWLASDKHWHILRDHPWHGALMLGGMWGVKGWKAMNSYIDTWNQEDRYQTDQDFLRSIVYPLAVQDAMIHAQFCAIERDAIPFPSPRSGLEFVGQVFDENDITVAEHQGMLMKALKMHGEPIRMPDFLRDEDKV